MHCIAMMLIMEAPFGTSMIWKLFSGNSQLENSQVIFQISSLNEQMMSQGKMRMMSQMEKKMKMMVKVTEWGQREAVRLSATASASAWQRPLCSTDSPTYTNTNANTNTETNTNAEIGYSLSYYLAMISLLFCNPCLLPRQKSVPSQQFLDCSEVHI